MSFWKSALACLTTAGAALSIALIGPSSQPASAADPAIAPSVAVAATGQAGAYGTIKGKLIWGGEKAPTPKIFANNNKDPQVCGTDPVSGDALIVDPSTKGVKFGVAYVVNPKGKNPEAEKALAKKMAKVEIDQKKCQFIPHMTALSKDQQLLFKSSDPVGHNVHYTGFNNGSKNVVLAPNGELLQKFVKESRPMTLVCDIHPWMSGWIMVLDHPFFTTTGDDGSFEITGVPAGTQNVIVWHEKAGYVTAGVGKGVPVTVKAGETVDLGEVKIDPSKAKQ